MTKTEILDLEIARMEAECMKNELEMNRLVVTLSGSLDDTGRKARVVESQNPDWYRNLFASYSNGVKGKGSRSCLRRSRVVSALDNISKGKVRDFFIYDVLTDEIESRLTEGYYIETEGIFVPPQV